MINNVLFLCKQATKPESFLQKIGTVLVAPFCWRGLLSAGGEGGEGGGGDRDIFHSQILKRGGSEKK